MQKGTAFKGFFFFYEGCVYRKRIISHMADFNIGHQEINLVSSPNTSSEISFCFDIPVCF